MTDDWRVARVGEWTEAALLRLIRDNVTESLTLDYKRSASLDMSDRKKAEMSKDVSAFATSAGGTLIYGIAEDKHVPTDLDGGYDPAVVTKERVEQVINGTIQPRVQGVRVHPVPLSGERAGREIICED